MCGFIGFNSKKYLKYIDKSLLQIRHRGPDDSGVYNDSNIVFGFQRLSILELTDLGHQPMISRDGNLVIVFNGEIYNHLEIRKSYLAKEFFKSKSDTETILVGYQKYGNDLFKMLNGIFSLAIYDKLKKKIVLARDPLGVKPLYYYQKDKQLFFSFRNKGIFKNSKFR